MQVIRETVNAPVCVTSVFHPAPRPPPKKRPRPSPPLPPPFPPATPSKTNVFLFCTVEKHANNTQIPKKTMFFSFVQFRNNANKTMQITAKFTEMLRPPGPPSLPPTNDTQITKMLRACGLWPYPPPPATHPKNQCFSLLYGLETTQIFTKMLRAWGLWPYPPTPRTNMPPCPPFLPPQQLSNVHPEALPPPCPPPLPLADSRSLKQLLETRQFQWSAHDAL